MITHQIVKHKLRIKLTTPPPPAVVASPHLPVLRPPDNYTPSALDSMHFLGKYQYAEMLKTLKFKVGDFCFFRDAEWPVDHDKEVYYVTDINQIHWMDKGNTLAVKKPMPYHLKNKEGRYRYANDDMLVAYNFAREEGDGWP